MTVNWKPFQVLFRSYLLQDLQATMPMNCGDLPLFSCGLGQKLPLPLQIVVNAHSTIGFHPNWENIPGQAKSGLPHPLMELDRARQEALFNR